MMNILQFKVGGEYEYNVTFETVVEKQKIQTNDRPTGKLLSAVSAVVISAIKYFQFENITAQFRSVTFSYPDNGPDTFVLEFTIKTTENVYVRHILKTEKLSLMEEDTESSDVSFQIRIEQNNSLIEKVLQLREEIVLYVQGEREQTDLPFEDGKSEITQDELFNDSVDILTAKARNISRFREVGKS